MNAQHSAKSAREQIVSVNGKRSIRKSRRRSGGNEQNKGWMWSHHFRLDGIFVVYLFLFGYNAQAFRFLPAFYICSACICNALSIYVRVAFDFFIITYLCPNTESASRAAGERERSIKKTFVQFHFGSSIRLRRNYFHSLTSSLLPFPCIFLFCVLYFFCFPLSLSPNSFGRFLRPIQIYISIVFTGTLEMLCYTIRFKVHHFVCIIFQWIFDFFFHLDALFFVASPRFCLYSHISCVCVCSWRNPLRERVQVNFVVLSKLQQRGREGNKPSLFRLFCSGNKSPALCCYYYCC